MKRERLYQGKAKQVFLTDNPNEVILAYQDQTTAFNGKKTKKIKGKGRYNNIISAQIFEYLTKNNLPNHFIKTFKDTEQLVEKKKMIPIEVVVHNLATVSIVERLRINE